MSDAAASIDGDEGIAMLEQGYAGASAITERYRHCARCGCRLSRYNSDSRCGGCQRLPADLPSRQPQVLPEVWANAGVQAALVARDFGRLCALVREASGLRQDDMVMLTGLSQSFLSMLETGARRLTNIDKIIILLDGLGTPAELTGPMLEPDHGLDDPHPRMDRTREAPAQAPLTERGMRPGPR
ncbi:helix-turn-helix domain-containing protein, partial [Streptomyces roseochromogenus]|uniref:helix-turn-helix domain-containing protein n=1 Tax=Streptomyces roseochromogenus TaxID=285450 RepID=UPI001FD8424C